MSWSMEVRSEGYDLIRAVREGRLEAARDYINTHGLQKSECCGYVLLKDALENGHSAVAELLLTSGARVNSKNQNHSKTALHFAAEHADTKIIKMILDRGANIDAKDREGKTPLHIAIKNNKFEVTEMLLKSGAHVHLSDSDGYFLLHVAAYQGCLQTVKNLLEHGASTDVLCTSRYANISRYTPLHFAVERGAKEVAVLLMSRGANANCKADDDITPLHIATKKGYVSIAEDLINHNSSCMWIPTLEKGYLPLHFASELGQEEAVKLFLNRGADVNVCAKDDLTPLHIAIKGGDKRVIKLLLERGAKVDAQDKNKKTTLNLAVEEKRFDIVEDILRYGPDIDSKANRSSLKIAVIDRTKDIMEALLEYGLLFNPEDANDPKLFHAAVEKGYLKVVKDLLITYGADVNTPEAYWRYTPLHSAVIRKLEDVAKLLLSHKADVNALDKNGKSPILYAIENADLKIAKLLLCNGSNVNAQAENGVTILHEACKKGHAEIIELLLEHNANVNSVEENSITPLHLSAQRGDSVIVKMLLKRGAYVNATEENETTALHLAAKKGHILVAEILLESGANVNCTNKSKLTPLLFSAEEGHHETVETILKFGADVESRDENGRTALHLASKNGHVKTVETLLKYGSKINPLCKDKYTALDYALSVKSLRKMVRNINNGRYYFVDQLIATLLRRHIVKLKTANFRVNNRNLRMMISNDEMKNLEDECKEEIARMKVEKFNKTNISIYDVLTKSSSTLSKYMRNESIVLVLKSDDYKSQFPIYASMIENNVRNGMQRKKLLDNKGDQICHILFNNFPELPYDCTEEIFNYLTIKDLKTLIEACELQDCINNV